MATVELEPASVSSLVAILPFAVTERMATVELGAYYCCIICCCWAICCY